MSPLQITALAIASLALGYAPHAHAASIDISNCEPIENLGVSNLDRFEYSLDMDVNESCEYTVQMKFKHDASLPVPDDPAGQCDPTIVPPVIASDGLPYFVGRWAYQTVPKHIRKSAGIDHISIDFNPCGHPPFNVFTVPHYDFHVYKVDPEYRSCMTCVQPIGAPICVPSSDAQTTSNGKGFFNVNTVLGSGDLSNMPAGFVIGLEDMIPLMGGHAWNESNQPSASNPWVAPMWMMGPYDGSIVNYEPMVPLSFVSGDTDNSHEEELTYKGQTLKELPSMYSVEYDAETKFTTLTFKGASLDCSSGAPKKPKSSKTLRR
jgi:hypothetical protein